MNLAILQAQEIQPERGLKRTDIFMIHMSKEFDLSKGPFRINPVVKGISNFLDSNLLLCLRVVCRAVVMKLVTSIEKVIEEEEEEEKQLAT